MPAEPSAVNSRHVNKWCTSRTLRWHSTQRPPLHCLKTQLSICRCTPASKRQCMDVFCGNRPLTLVPGIGLGMLRSHPPTQVRSASSSPTSTTHWMGQPVPRPLLHSLTTQCLAHRCLLISSSHGTLKTRMLLPLGSNLG